MKTFIIGFLMIPALALAGGVAKRQASNTYNTQQNNVTNYVKNPDAEINLANVTASGATVSRGTSTPIQGVADFNISNLQNNATDTVTWSTNTLDLQLKGGNCALEAYYTASSVGSNVVLEVLQGSNVIAKSPALSVNSSPTKVTLNSTCGDLSTATTIVLRNDTGNTGTSALHIDSLKYGFATNIYTQPPQFSCTGGTITNAAGRTIHTFSSTGILSCSGTAAMVDSLLVAGGGAGGDAQGAGGGGGGVLYTTGNFTGGAVFTITIGAGGTVNSGNGGNTTFNGLVAIGGGGGGGSASSYNGFSGGSGGGCHNSTTPGSGTAGQGNAGGACPGNTSPNFPGSGGGGAGATGGAVSGATAGNGGNGVSNSITGAAVTYGGGGGGGGSVTGGSGGTGGGGAGGTSTGTAGTDGLGGGGGGAATTPGKGGSGLAIISYVTPAATNAITLYTPDLQALSWSGYYTNSGNINTTSASYTDFTVGGTGSITERSNNNFGTVTAAGSNLPGFTFTPKKTGNYYACAYVYGYQATSSKTASYQLTNGGGGAYVRQTIYNSGGATFTPIPLCSIVPITSLSPFTLKVQGASSSGGTAWINNDSLTDSVTFDIFALDQNIPAPVLVPQIGLVAAIHFAPTSSCQWDGPTASTLTAISSNGNCPAPTQDYNDTSLGTLTLSHSGLPELAINNLPAGTYQLDVIMPLQMVTSATEAGIAWSDGTTTSGTSSHANAATGVQNNVKITGIFTYASSGNRTFSILLAGGGGSGKAEIINNSIQRQTNMYITKVK